MNAYKKLTLTREQRKVLKEVQDVMQKAVEVGLHFIEAPGYGCYAYNAKKVSCFNAPENAAYDNEKDLIEVMHLEEAFRFGLTAYDLLNSNQTECLVVFD
ncbi:MAG: hypothetical protein K6F94_07310 [Bacteroidaceae bacterium]|nr:hypothetical protein [Bacteroidaceae bacterium]